MSWYERPYADGGEGGGGGWRFPENPLNWAPRIGRVAGIRIRVHMLFLLYILFELLGAGEFFAYKLQLLFILFGSVFLHELGHCFAARRVGGSADDVLMWPLGGLATIDAPRAPWPQFVTVIGGPLVNVVLLGLAAGLLRVPGIGSIHVSVNPFSGWAATGNSWGDLREWLRLIYQLNWALFLFNLWPMYPMDGGRILQCVLWPRLGLGRSMLIATFVGMMAAIALGLYGLAAPMKMNLVAVAIMGYVVCMRERQMLRAGVLVEESYTSNEFSGPYTSAARSPRRREGWFAGWRRRRGEARRRQAVEQSAMEQVEVDRILAKVHDHGLASLTRAERRTLETATRRQRERESSVH